MSIKRKHAAFTLVEVLIFVTITTLVIATGTVLAHNFMRSMAFLTNSVDLDTKSRLAVDRVTREIRSCDAIEAAASDSLVLRTGGSLTTYAHDKEKRELIRMTPDDGTNVVLSGCEFVRFDLFQRQPLAGAYDNYPPTTDPKLAKVVQFHWVCTRYLLGFKANTTTMQSAKVVIRKK